MTDLQTKIIQLEKDRVYLYEQEQSLLKKVQELQSQLQNTQKENDTKHIGLQKKLHQLQEQFQDDQQKIRDLQHTIGQQKFKFESQLKNLQLENNHLKSQLELKQNFVLQPSQKEVTTSSQTEEKENEMQESNQMNAEKLLKDLADTKVQNEQLKTEILSLKVENNQYKLKMKDFELLQEQNRNLESKVKQTDSLIEKICRLEIQISKLSGITE